jgi:hypothetical protein
MTASLRRRVADFLCRVQLAVLPSRLRSWGQAIRVETAAVPGDTAALWFALESLLGMLPRAIAWHVMRPFAGSVEYGAPFTGRPVLATAIDAISSRPRGAGIVCAAGGVALV